VGPRAGWAIRAAIGAEIGALAGATAGLFAGFAAGSLTGLPRYRLGNDPEGFDTLDAALIGLAIGWLAGALVGSRLATRHRARPALPIVVVALGCMAALLAGSMVVGSATADWYDPLVFLLAPPVAMATITAAREAGAT
jgi:LytS/YehU family sensor histidine kinase